MKYFILIIISIIPIVVNAQWNLVNTNTQVSINAIHFKDSLQGYFVGGGDENGNVNGDEGVIFKHLMVVKIGLLYSLTIA